jgi:hypothetical protein
MPRMTFVFPTNPTPLFMKLMGLKDGNRCKKLLRISIQNQDFNSNLIENFKRDFSKSSETSMDETDYFIFSGTVENSAYKSNEEQIKILFKNGNVVDLKSASDQLGLPMMSKSVKKFFLCYPKSLGYIK